MMMIIAKLSIMSYNRQVIIRKGKEVYSNEFSGNSSC